MPITSCKLCGKKFYAKPSHLKRGWGKYCSQKCQYKGYRTGSFVKCDTCGKEIYRTKKELRCSKSKIFFAINLVLQSGRIIIYYLEKITPGGRMEKVPIEKL